MNIKPLKTKTDYKAALKEIDSLMRAKPGTPAGDRLDVIVTLVQAYEAKHSRLTCLIRSKPSSSPWNKKG